MKLPNDAKRSLGKLLRGGPDSSESVADLNQNGWPDSIRIGGRLGAEYARIPAEDGFDYIAADAAAPFLASLSSTYSQKLKDRALWAVERFAGAKTSEIRQITYRLFENWTSQFQAIDRPRGCQ